MMDNLFATCNEWVFTNMCRMPNIYLNNIYVVFYKRKMEIVTNCIMILNNKQELTKTKIKFLYLECEVIS